MVRQERDTDRDLTLAFRPHAPSCPCHHHLQLGGFERGGGWLIVCTNPPKDHPALGTALLESVSDHRIVSLGRASLHPALPWIEGWRADPGGTTRCPLWTNGRQ